MKRFKAWIKVKVQQWLGIIEMDLRIRDARNDISRIDRRTTDLVSIGVDVHFKEPHMILIYSRLNGGQLREIRADFKDMRELQQFVEELKNRFNTRFVTVDRPQGIGKRLFGW